MRVRKHILTTGDVAKICHVAPRTVSKWFDTGQLRGYRIPGSRDRRIPIEQLVRFMRAHGLPLDALERGWTRILLIDADQALSEGIAEALRSHREYEVATADSALAAGAAAQQLKPDVVIVDVTLPDLTPKTITRFVRSQVHTTQTCLIGIGRGLTQAQGQELLQEGFDAYLSKPFEVHALIELIERNTSATPVQGDTQ